MTTLHRAVNIPTNLFTPHSFTDSFFGSSSMAEKALLQRFLPFNSGEDSDTDPYSTDHFRMYEFKVRRCTRPRCHDWTDCPFVHPGEKARRRDPRKYHYSGNACAEFRRGSCSRGDNCEFAHGVFETWLHPAKYRTEACKDGKNCKRKVCFFAHTPRQLRLLPPSPPPEKASSIAGLARDYLNLNHGCRFCHSPVPSPTSTLVGMSHFDKLSPPMSPPPLLSPGKSRSLAGFCPISCGVKPFSSSPLSYRDVVDELRVSMEDMKLSEDSRNFKNLPWVDDGGCRNGGGGGEERRQSHLPPRRGSVESGLSCPDIDWVNDLLT